MEGEEGWIYILFDVLNDFVPGLDWCSIFFFYSIFIFYFDREMGDGFG